MGDSDRTPPGFAGVLRELREQAGLTQEELAERAGLTQHAVSALERGVRTRPYQHTVRALAGGLRASDDELRRLLQAVPRRGTSRKEPVAYPGEAHVSAGLLVPPTPLHGRAGDIEAVAALFRSGQRLVTITGPGGVGKTRLAAAAADRLAAEHPGGVVGVSLAHLSDASAVVPTVARAFGVVGVEGPGAAEELANRLVLRADEGRVLLLLDNLEHLLTAADELATLVARCAQLAVLATSRSPLRLRYEHEYPLSPLDLPSLEPSTLRELEASAAGALVLERMQAVAPRGLTGSTADADVAGALGRLCHRLAGIPLAIELATAHLRTLSPELLLERLDEVLGSAGARDLPERQRTMRTTLDWSYQLLDEEQQRLFRVFGVFRGGATLGAVEHVAVAVGIDKRRVVGVLHDLVEHSMVLVRHGAAGESRYGQLEPVAQYARGLLVNPEAATAVTAHAAWFRDLTEQAASGYEHADQVTWLARVQDEEANILLAIDRALDTGDGVTAGRITWATWLYWWLRGQVVLGRRKAEQCLPVVPPEIAARVHLTAATMSYAAGEVEAAAGHWAESLRLGSEFEDAEVKAKAGAGTGLADLAAGDLDGAEARFTAALRDGEVAGDAGIWIRSLTHVWLGTLLILRGQPARARAQVERGLDLARGRGDRLATYVGLYNLSQAHIALGQAEEARRHLAEGIALSRETRDRANLAYFLEALAVVEAVAGRHPRVPVLLGAGQAMREAVGADVYGYYQPDEAAVRSAEREARSALGDDAYDEAFAGGTELDLDAAAELGG